MGAVKLKAHPLVFSLEVTKEAYYSGWMSFTGEGTFQVFQAEITG